MKLIAVEGWDGAGKTTLVNNLKNELAKTFLVFDIRRATTPQIVKKVITKAKHEENPVIITKEPTPFSGIEVKRLIEQEEDPLIRAHLFAADRAIHHHYVLKPLQDKEDAIIITDRYIHSNLTYQFADYLMNLKKPYDEAILEEKFFNTLLQINNAFPPADLVLYLDVSPSVAWARIDQRGHLEVYERNKARIRLIRALYSVILEEKYFTKHVARLNATQPPKQLTEEALTVLALALLITS